MLDTIPGVGRRTAEQVLAEIGTNMEQFPSAAHLCSWAGLAPGNNESAGKRKSGRTRKGNQKLRAALVEAARAAARSRQTYLSSQYHRIAGRRGANRAAIAVAHSILTIAYHILRKRAPYHELGGTYFEERRKDAVSDVPASTRSVHASIPVSWISSAVVPVRIIYPGFLLPGSSPPASRAPTCQEYPLPLRKV